MNSSSLLHVSIFRISHLDQSSVCGLLFGRARARCVVQRAPFVVRWPQCRHLYLAPRMILLLSALP